MGSCSRATTSRGQGQTERPGADGASSGDRAASRAYGRFRWPGTAPTPRTSVQDSKRLTHGNRQGILASGS
jgi:hypothetical protein